MKTDYGLPRTGEILYNPLRLIVLHYSSVQSEEGTMNGLLARVLGIGTSVICQQLAGVRQ